ncbi:SpaA isopeptide-forming pilin-related protein [Bifidobacterium eulemuris]|uniref:Collagen-binding protein n=1 Tax=Bifidobacterium eulemuris TaxID=1765219 RepID=A0A261G3M3_9BIFI|nr:SpaA isopeptide-forming pilin-related protein [Bifidobacterium eulemuris]OZG66017.1 collagen-binding protein [Bifidobacterium eulemuris]QOL32070.1 LPXTG cell wall anchor domain-containing protein [Bifidobacterium eulemuris]
MKMRKLFAGIAAAATMLAGLTIGATTANAADPCTVTLPTASTITINAENAAQLTSHTFKYAKIGDYTADNGVAGVKTTTGVAAASIKSALIAAGVEEGTLPTSGDLLSWAVQEGDLLDQTGTKDTWGLGSSRAFADSLKKSLTLSDVLSDNITISDKTAKLTMTSPGLYLIVDNAAVTNGSTSSSKSLAMLVGTEWLAAQSCTANDLSTGTINMKNSVDTINKTIADETVAVNKDASYTLTTKIPTYAGGLARTFQFKVGDQFDSQYAPSMISYKSGSVVVKVNNAELAGTDYTLTYYDANGDPTTDLDNAAVKFDIDLSSYVRKNGYDQTKDTANDGKFNVFTLQGAEVVVTYLATVHAQLPLDGVKNSPYIQIPNDPYDNSTLTTIPGPGKKVFNFPLVLKKTDKTTGGTLDGAEFALKDSDGTTVATATSKNGGLVTFEGLDADESGTTYTVEETKAPTDHILNPLDKDLEVIITPTFDGVNEAREVTQVVYELTDNMGGLASLTSSTITEYPGQSPVVNITVANVKNLTELPLTGGAGVALFSVIGLLLVGAAATVYVKMRGTKKALRA